MLYYIVKGRYTSKQCVDIVAEKVNEGVREMNRPLNLHSSKYPELCVDIQKYHMNDGRIRVIGTAIRAEDEAEYPDIAPYKTKPVSRKRINSAITEAIAVVESRYYEHYGEGELTEAAFRAAFQSVEEAVANGLCLKPTWDSASTNNDVIRFFKRNTLPLLIPKLVSAQMLLDEDRVDLQTEMTSICARHGSESELAAQENANKRLVQAEIVLSHMRDHDARIPGVRLTSSEFAARAYRKEQIKMLPIPVLVCFYHKLLDLVEKEPKKVFFAILVVFNCRPAEAAGTKPSDIAWHDSFCSVRIEHQEINGRLSTKMKNAYSKRLLIVCYWGMLLLLRCCELIGDNYPSDDDAMNDAVECAAWVKRLLVECGATEVQLKELGSELTNEDLDDSSVYDPKKAEETTRDKTTKIGCYVLRRCAATIMRVYMGLTLYETDRLLGHIPHGSGKNKASTLSHPDLNSPETQRRIAAKMERYVFDPAYSLNPKYSPIMTAGKESIPLLAGYSEVVVENNEESDLWVEIDLSATEAGDPLSLTLPERDCGALSSSSVPVSYDGVNRTVFVEVSEDVKER